MTRGNQRELARQKNARKNQETSKKKGADQKDGNKGLSLETRKHRDAEVMREKQKKAEVMREKQKAEEHKGEPSTSDKK